MKKRQLIFYIFTLLISVISFQLNAQDRFSFGAMPNLSIDYNISDKFSVDHSSELVQNIYNKNDDFIFNFSRIEFQNIIEYKSSEISKIGLGYLFRIADGHKYYHRSIQQYSFKKPVLGYSLSHRLRADQTFSADTRPLFRFRYRLKKVFKFKEEELSPGDLYMASSLEGLYKLDSETDDIETRVYLALGFFFNEKNDLEIGFELRSDDYLESGFRNRLWLTVSYAYHL
ncbi:MAG: DUF2490 domain-containing protein [Psychroflexus halocasei]